MFDFSDISHILFSITVAVESDIFLVFYYNSSTYFSDYFQSVPNSHQHYHISGPASNYYNSRFQPSVIEKKKKKKKGDRIERAGKVFVINVVCEI